MSNTIIKLDLQIDLSDVIGYDYESVDTFIIDAIRDEIKNQVKASTKSIRAKVKAAIAKEETRIAKKMTADIMKGIETALQEKIG